MFRVALRPIALVLCFLTGVFVTQTTHQILFEREFKYVGVACGPNNYVNFYKTSDGAEVRHAIIGPSGMGAAEFNCIERIEELSRRRTARILGRWPRPLIHGRNESEKLLAVSTQESDPTAALVWIDEFGL